MFKAIDEKIRKSFSNAAVQYDVLSSLHKEIGRDLLKKVMPRERCGRILDVGMGTGWLTGKTAFYFPGSRVVGIDFAPGMIDRAKNSREGFEIIQADANILPFKEDSFDIIISNLAYQWVEDLDRAFRSCRSCLKSDGVFCFTAFGRETLWELFDAFEQSRQNEAPLPFYRLASEERIKEALCQCGFKVLNIDSERIKVRFPDFLSLVKWIKGIGANSLSRKPFIGKDLWARADTYYEQHYKDRFGIYATFEVIWVEAEK